jgi:hypothetical protein
MATISLNHSFSQSPFVAVQFSQSPSQLFPSFSSPPAWEAEKQQASSPALPTHMQQQYTQAAAFEALIMNLQQQVSQLTALVMADRDKQAELCARIDLLVAAAAQSADLQKTVWKCPVCCIELSHMRSFKGHVKRLYEFYHNQHRAPGDVPHAQHRCQLLSASKRHVNLVSLSGPPGSQFPERSKAFAFVLWQYVQALTSSEEDLGFFVDDSIMGGGAFYAGGGVAPADDDLMGHAPGS